MNVMGVGKGFGGQSVFSDVTFSLGKGERLGLVGRNGSGKSTLLRIMTGEVAPDAGGVSFPKGTRIGYLRQHIDFQAKTVLEEALRGIQAEEFLAEKFLSGLGIDEEMMQADPKSLSGGYALRLHLAKMFLTDPDVLLLDEPTNYLDIVSIDWLKKFLSRWNKELILISHDRAFMDAIVTHVGGIHREKFRKVPGQSDKYYEMVVLEEEHHERTRIGIERKKAHAESFIRRFGAKATKAKQARSKQKMISKLPSLDRLAELEELDFSFKEAPFPGKLMLRAENLTFGYDEPLIRDFSLTLEPGERLAIIGKNGRGKSTLLNLLAGDLKPWEGGIKYADNLEIGIFGQTHIQRLHPEHTVEEEISLANRDLGKGEIMRIAGMMLFSGDLAKKPIQVLSGGERARVQLGKILASKCNLLLLDEPTHHLDTESIEALMTAIDNFAGTVVVVSHSEVVLDELAPTRLIICREGSQELFFGDYADFLEKRGWEETKKERKPKGGNDYRLLKKELERIERKIARGEESPELWKEWEALQLQLEKWC